MKEEQKHLNKLLDKAAKHLAEYDAKIDKALIDIFPKIDKPTIYDRWDESGKNKE